MITSIAFVLLGSAAAAATPCENLVNLKLPDTTITSSVVVPERPAPARGGGGGAPRGGAAPGGAPQQLNEVRLLRIFRPTAAFSWFSSRRPIH
jgi:hypothetical protein